MGQAETASKGTVVRAIVRELRRSGDYDLVRERVGPATRAILDDLPPITAFVPLEEIEPLLVALEALRGLGAVRALARAAATNDIAPVLANFLTSALRLFGATPHTLFARMNDMVKNTTRGLRVEYTRVGERSARLLHVFEHRRAVPAAQWAAIAGGLEFVFAITKTPGHIDEPRVLRDGRENAAEFDAHW